MATRPVFTLDDVLVELDGNEEYEDDSDDDFDGYVEMNENEGEQGAHVGANVEIGAAEMDEMDESDGNEELYDSDEPDSVPVYALEPGCSVPVEGDRPLDYFSLLVTNDMLEHIVTHTNLYAQQFINSHDLPPHSRVRRWSKGIHDVNELKRFLAIIIIMGLVRYPQIESHWSTMWPFTNSHCSSVSVCTIFIHINVYLQCTYNLHVYTLART